MSAQGATLGRRGTMLHLPIWPVVILVTAVAAVTIGVTMIGEQDRDATLPFTLSGEAANSTTAIRESGVVVPAQPDLVFENTTAIREQGVALPGVGVSHVAPSVGFAGFENPGAYITEAPTYAPGLEYPGAYPTDAGSSPADPHSQIVVNGNVCPQCR